MRNLSIVVPHFQKQDTLVKVIEALRQQVHDNDEIIIVDDHSPQGCPVFSDPQIKTIQPPKHVPHIYRLNTVRNHGIMAATNDWCILLDADCVPQPNFISHARKIYDPSILFTAWIKLMDRKGEVGEGIRGEWDIPWLDEKERGCLLVRGGCMVFSKQRVKLVGLFDTDFDGTWGYGENVFASACYHSGMRLRFEKELIVHHQWHKPNRVGTTSHNRHLLTEKRTLHRTQLNHVTPYNPVNVVLMIAPDDSGLLDEMMSAVFRQFTPLKVRLVSNGEPSQQQEEAIKWWRGRWAVDYVEYENPRPIYEIKRDTEKHYKCRNYKHLITVEAIQ